MKKITKWQLLTAFAERQPIAINDTAFTVINQIQHEDGSSSSFNVTGICQGKERTVYTKTID